MCVFTATNKNNNLSRLQSTLHNPPPKNMDILTALNQGADLATALDTAKITHQPEKPINLSFNTPENQGEITQDASIYFSLPIEDIETVYEYGQWWVIVTEVDPCYEDPTTYSVVETSNGLDYEEVNRA